MLALLLSGCVAGAGYSTRDRVTAAAREYNDGVRWGKWEQAAAHIIKDDRMKFLERHQAYEDELEIADYELTAARVFVNGEPRIEVIGGYRPGNNQQYIP